MPKYIHVIEIDLSIDIEEEIKKEVGILSIETKERIKNAVSIKRPTKDQMKIEEIQKLETIFDTISVLGSISKEKLASLFEIEPENIGPSIQKFKRYLKSHRPDWAINNKTSKKQKIYELSMSS